MIAHGRPSGRRWLGEAIALGVFAAVQTFIFFARQDRFSVLLWWTRESWLYVAVLWLKDLFLAAVAFLVFAEMARATVSLPEEAGPEDRRSRLRDALLFGLILAAGIALRWLAPRQIPPGVWADALFEAEGALRDPTNVPWLGGTPVAIEGLRNSTLVSNFYLQFCAFLFRILGRGDAGILALSAVGGTLSLPAVYWIGREVSGRRAALSATGLAAFGLLPLIVSRWGWTLALLLPLLLGAAAAALSAVRTGRLSLAVVSGVLLGLSFHTHAAAWAASAGFVVYAASVLRRPEHRRFVVGAVVGCLVAALPYVVGFAEHTELLGGRARDVSFIAPTKDVTIPGGNGPAAPPIRLLYNTVEYTGLFLWTKDPNPRDGLPGRPAFTPLLGLAALSGIAVTVRQARQRDERSRLLLLLGGAILLAGILGNPGGAPNVLRIYPFVGLVAIWASIALDRWLAAVSNVLRIRMSFVWALAFVAFFLLETRVFLTEWPDHRMVMGSFCAPETEAGRTLRALGPAPVVVAPKALSWPIVLETLAAGKDPSRPVPRFPRRTPEDLVHSRLDGPFWYVARDEDLEILRRASWRCPPRRGAGTDRTAVFRVVPPRG